MTLPTVLAQPLQLPNGSTLKNRLAKAAMSEQLAGPDHHPNDGLVRLYERWARGGAGLLITGNVMIDRDALGEPGNVVLDQSSDLDGFVRWAQAGRQDDTQLWMQLNHPGRQSPRTLSREPVAPSEVPLQLRGVFNPPRALSGAEIEALVERFAHSAALAERAGFSGVQLHAAHGYLISQFLSPLTNKRTDEWGGAIENRMRFLLRVVRAVRERVRAEFGVAVKLNSADFQRGGFDETDSVAVVRALSAEAVDLLEISGGTYERAAMWGEGSRRDSTTRREAYFLDYAASVRDASAIPLMLTGGFHTVQFMADTVASGAIAVVGLARPLALEPDFPEKALAGVTDAALRVEPKLGIAILNKIATGLWHQWQLWRMAGGRPPKPKASRFVILRLLWFSMFAGRNRKRRQRKCLDRQPR